MSSRAKSQQTVTFPKRESGESLQDYCSVSFWVGNLPKYNEHKCQRHVFTLTAGLTAVLLRNIKFGVSKYVECILLE